MAKAGSISRRAALKGAAAASALPLFHVRRAGAAGKLSLGLWDHWVQAANPVLKGIVDEWAQKNSVDFGIVFDLHFQFPAFLSKKTVMIK